MSNTEGQRYDKQKNKHIAHSKTLEQRDTRNGYCSHAAVAAKEPTKWRVQASPRNHLMTPTTTDVWSVSYRSRELAFLLASLLMLAGCSGLRIDETPHVSAISTAPPPSSCLAMSGGGIRSGAVSLGALQGLHSASELSRFSFISTVSGGGYPVYGLLDQMLRKDVSLTELLSETGGHISRVEERTKFIDTSDMYTAAVLGPTLWAALSWPLRAYGAGRPTYEAKIHQTFAGGLIPLWGKPKLDRASEIHSKGFPIPIFGASASTGPGQPLSGYVYRFDHFFELSPTLSGAPKTGYFSSLSRQTTIADAVAMSAAAIDTPQGALQLPAIAKAWNLGLGGAFYAPTDNGPRTHFYLADGGFIENLGLLPLLRRGCREILAFDNSDDDTRPFDAWINFETRLATEEPGWIVTSPLRSASGRELPTNDYERWRLHDHIWDAALKQGDNLVRIRVVKLGINKEKLRDYPASVQEFAIKNWAESEPKCDKKGLSRRCSFPLEATARQSFEKEEFRAYRHLGKWLAELAIHTPSNTSE